MKKLFAMLALCIEVFKKKSDASQVFEQEQQEDDAPESWPGIYFDPLQTKDQGHQSDHSGSSGQSLCSAAGR